MSRVTGAPNQRYELVPPYEIVHDGYEVPVKTIAYAEALRDDNAVARYQVKAPGFQENADSFAKYARWAVRHAYEKHGKALHVVTYSPHQSVYSQKAQTGTFLKIVEHALEHSNGEAIDVVGHSRGAKTAILGSLAIGEPGVIRRVWGLTPAGFDRIEIPTTLPEAADAVMAGVREFAGDAKLMFKDGLPNLTNMRVLGGMAARMPRNLLGNVAGAWQETHELRTEVIADAAAELSKSDIVEEVGMVVGWSDGLCRAVAIRRNLLDHGFEGSIVGLNIPHLAPLIDKSVAVEMTDHLYGQRTLSDAA